MSFPSSPLSREQVLDTVSRWRADDLATHGGRTFTYVYDSGRPDVDAVAAEVATQFLWHNGLDPTVFPSLARLENDVVGMLVGHLGGGPGTAAPDAVGTVTSGGTESCILAVKAARDRWRAAGGGVPELVLPATAHAAFHKAAHLLGLEVRLMPVDPSTALPSVADFAAAVGESTALVVVSAPSYSYSVVDPVAEVAALASARGISCHVDACLGGIVLPYLRRSGVDIPAFDFSVPGVTSISVDLHKFGYTPKGVSVLLHRDPELRRWQFWAGADWAGYPVVNTTMQSTKTAAPLAAAWAALRLLGSAGLERLSRDAWEATGRIAAGVAEIPGLRVFRAPDGPAVALVGTGDPATDVWALVDAMRSRGWYLQSQPARHGMPPTVHLTVSAASLPLVDDLLSDLAAATEEVRRSGPTDVSDLVGALDGLDPAALTPEAIAGLLAGFGGGEPATGGELRLPDRMAAVHALLSAVPPDRTEALLIAVLDAIYRPTTRGIDR